MSSQTPFGRGLGSKHDGMQINEDIMITERFVGGPGTGKDARMYVGKEALEHMLAVANVSGTKRVVLTNVGIRVSEWRKPNGHVYEVWSFFSAEPQTEKGTPFSRIASDLKRKV